MTELTLQLIIEQIDDNWFTERVYAFNDHPLLDKKTDKLRWTITSKNPNYTERELEVLSKIEAFVIPTGDKEITLEKDFGGFLRDHLTLPEYAYKQPMDRFYDSWKVVDFMRLETLCLSEIDNVLKQTNSLQEKYLILTRCEQIIKEVSDKQAQKFTELGYQFFLFQWYFSHTIRNSYKYQNAFWYMENCVNPKDASVKPEKTKPRKISKDNLKILFSLFDEDHTPLIADEDKAKIDSFIDCFYELYNGRQPKKKIIINLGWKAEPAYYLISKIFETKPKITLSKFCEYGCLTIKGQKLKPNLVSKGAGDYRANKLREDFRNYIDTEMLFQR